MLNLFRTTAKYPTRTKPTQILAIGPASSTAMMFQDRQGLNAMFEVQEGRVGDEKYVKPLRAGQDPEIRSASPMDEKHLDEKGTVTEKPSTKGDEAAPKVPARPQVGFWGNIVNTFVGAFAGPPLPGHSIYAFPGPGVGLPIYANFGLDPELAMALWGLNTGRDARWEGSRRGPRV